MDIRPAVSSLPPTSALDALKRVQSSAAADDSEDSQTAGYLFGDGRQQRPGADDAEPDEADADVVFAEDRVELSADTRLAHLSSHVDDSPAGSDSPAPTTTSPERHIDIEA